MNILITGITGFVGRNLSIKLKEKGFNVFGIIRKGSDKNFLIENNINFFIYESNDLLLKDFLIENKIDGIIHLATFYLINNDSNDIENLVNSNITFGTKLLELASNLGIKWFLNTSSFIQNYENKEYSPQNLYAATKQAFEDIGKYYYESGKIIFLSISLVNTYGVLDTRKKIFNIWNDISKTGELLNSTSGEQFIDILYIDDVIEAYICLINLIKKDKKIINGKKFIVSSGKILKLKELAKVFQEVMGKKININWGGIEHRKREIMYPYNIGINIPGWKPKTSLNDGIKKLLNK